jgi:hypothetical protein
MKLKVNMRMLYNQELTLDILDQPIPRQPQELTLTSPCVPHFLQAHHLTGSRAKNVAEHEQQLDIIGGNKADRSTKAMQAATAAPTTCSTICLKEAAPLLVRGWL